MGDVIDMFSRINRNIKETKEQLPLVDYAEPRKEVNLDEKFEKLKASIKRVDDLMKEIRSTTGKKE